MIAITIGGTNTTSLSSNFSIFARAGSNSKRLMTTASCPPFKIDVWAATCAISFLDIRESLISTSLEQKQRGTLVGKAAVFPRVN